MFGHIRARSFASKAGLCAALLGSTALPAYAADVSGRVLDPTTGAALPGATIAAAGRTAIADRDGVFVIRDLPAGPIELTFTYIGYPSVTRSATSSDSAAIVDFRLNPPSGDVSGGEIVVTGQRAAERRALQAKRSSNFIQDTLNANDVGKLPDQNVAEAVRRLPGISVANDQGEGRYVIIRGVNPNLANVTINGQTAPAPEPESRQVKLDDIPSSLIGSVTVVKSLTPDRDANAIAGQVDINTLTAFDRTKAFANARLVSGYNTLNSRSPYEGDITAGTRFGPDKTFGVVLSGNYSSRPIESENLQGSSNWGTPTGASRALPDDYRIRDYNLNRTRYGVVGNFDWRPSSDVNVYLRTLYSTFKDHETRDQSRIEIPVTYATTNAAGVTTQPTAAQQAVNAAISNGGTFSSRGTRFLRLRNEDDSTFSGELGGKFRFGGSELQVEGTYSKALKKDPLRSEFSFRTGSTALTGLSLDLADTLFKVNTANGTPYNSALYSGYRVSYDRRRAEENLYQARADLTIPIDFGSDSTIKLGGKFQQTDKSNNRDFQQYSLSGTLAATGAASDDGSAIYDGRYLVGPRINYDQAQTYYTVTNPSARTQSASDSATSVANSLVNDYDLSEKVFAGYIMGTFKFAKFTIVPGVRVEHTDGTYKGKAFTATSLVTQGFNVSNSRAYTDAFPDLNVRFDVNDRLVLRAAATTAIGRPDYNLLAPYVNVSDTTPNAGVVALGNPKLKPYKAVSGDFSAEYYLAGQGIISIAGFYKHLDDPIFTVGTTQGGTFGGTTFTRAQVTQPVNGDSAKIYGVEANLQAQLTFLPGALSGFGVSGNFTYTDGSSRGVIGRAGSVPNLLQSKYIGTAQLYYEKYGLTGRLAYTYRSAYLDTLGTTAATDQYTDENNSLDARIGYSPVKQFTVFVEASNLLDSPWRRYQAVKTQLIESERYRQTFRIGVQLAY
ncbi:TonB-dependent receptor [Sphingomonas glacialis]|uniref:TonB-dependent receptor n=1 Tax=Sphingomonas glacialis TaxID=658225 RepID=A0A502G241_9SPHN|nr:TonB-dependent receptor [Sphingomonas glacialis]TPG56007.1 TonB-dependent receptor [Sphingomonas glacialis]